MGRESKNLGMKPYICQLLPVSLFRFVFQIADIYLEKYEMKNTSFLNITLSKVYHTLPSLIKYQALN